MTYVTEYHRGLLTLDLHHNYYYQVQGLQLYFNNTVPGWTSVTWSQQEFSTTSSYLKTSLHCICSSHSGRNTEILKATGAARSQSAVDTLCIATELGTYQAICVLLQSCVTLPVTTETQEKLQCS